MANNNPGGNGVRRPRTSKKPRGRFILKRVKLTTGGNQQVLAGFPGVIKGISLTYSAGANASGVVKIRKGVSTGPIAFTATTGTNTTNAATGQMMIPCTDGLNNANSLVADSPGLYFNNGLFIEYGSATAGDTVTVKLLIDVGVRYHSVDMLLVGSNGSATATNDLFVGRPGVLKALRVSASAAATADFTLAVDPDTRESNALGATVFTATNFGATAVESAAVANTPASILPAGIDEANGAVTAPLGGGVPFSHGLRAVVAQGNSAETITVEYWIEV